MLLIKRTLIIFFLHIIPWQAISAESELNKSNVQTYNPLIKISDAVIEENTYQEKLKQQKAEYNKKLSERRSKSVVDYLISKGIKADRLQYAGYGFDRPISTNDTEEGRQLNRRTEFEIIGN